jgi:MipA family protein
LPNIRLAYEDKFFASVSEGIGYNIVNNDKWSIGPLARYDFGRDEDGASPFNVGGSDTNDLLGLGDVDGAVELGGFIEYKIRPFSAKIKVLKGTGGHEGTVSDLSIKYSGRSNLFNTAIMYNLGPNIKIADSNYHQSYFGVNSKQSRASGLARYDADAGILSYGLGGMAIIPMNKNISTVVFANYSKLGSESANSSLVQERGSDNQRTFGLFVNYSF